MRQINSLSNGQYDYDELETYKMILMGSLKKFPHHFWENDLDKIGGTETLNASRICVKYLLEEVLKWNHDDICNELNNDTFVKYKLAGMMSQLFNHSTYLALENAYPGEFNPFELKLATVLWEPNSRPLAKIYMDTLVKKMEANGSEVNEKSLLTFDWKSILRNHRLMGILKFVYNEDYQEFFNDIFSVQFSDEQIAEYIDNVNKLNYLTVKIY